jgi:hypothetical protein
MKKEGKKLTKRQIAKDSQYVHKLLYDWNTLIIRNGILYSVSNMNSETTYQLVLPVDYREVVLKGLHDDAGHQGRDRTLYLVKYRFYWPGVNKDVENKVSTCPKSNMNSETTYQLVLSVDYREVVLKGLHDDAGHQGRDRTLYLVKSRFYWPGVNKDVENKVSTCTNCILRKTKVKNSAELICIKSCQPLELICIYFFQFRTVKGRLF